MSMILPEPGKTFVWRDTPYGPALVCPPLETVAPHLFTTASWMLGRARDAEPAWAEVAAALGSSPTHLRRARQVHGSGVVVADGPVDSIDRLPDADIIITGSADLTVAVQVADCVPLLIADSRTGAVAAAHAGWRGLALDVPGRTIAALSASFGSHPDDLVAAIGPAIGACCYEVGADVRAAFASNGVSEPRLAEWFRLVPAPFERNPPLEGVSAAGRSGRWYFDPWGAARDQLVRAGVPGAQIFSAELCTASHPGVFCSYRREGVSAGRVAAAITPSARP